MEQLIRRQRLCLLLLVVVVFLSAAVGGARAVDARAGGQGIGIDQSNISVPTIKIGGGGHGGHGGHGHGNGGGEHGRGMPETPPVFDPRTVGANNTQRFGCSFPHPSIHRCNREGRRSLEHMAPMALKGVAPKQAPAKGAYVTFLAGSGDYWKGVVGLAKGLRAVKSAYPLVVAVLPDVPEDHRRKLLDQGCVIREIEPIYPPESQTQFAMAYYVINYSKLRIWEFVEYEKMVYLDADIQVFANIDYLFDLEKGSFYAVMDCFCEKTWSHTPQYKIGYCQQCPDRVVWPEHDLGLPVPSLYFNAGMFVHEPSLATAKALLKKLVVTDPTPFAEQDFLNMFFRDVYKPISNVHNLVLAMLWRHPENVELDKVKAVHYCAAGSKPWRFTGEEANMDREDIKMLVKKWWDIYNDDNLDYQGDVADEATDAPLRAALSDAIAVKYYPAPSAA